MLDRPDPATAEALARLYDLDLTDDPGDLDLYLALANRTGGPILELAVGSGRLAVPLVEAGHDVTGVDLDPAMLARARRRAHAAGAGDAAGVTGREGTGDAAGVAGREGAGDAEGATGPAGATGREGAPGREGATGHLTLVEADLVGLHLPDAGRFGLAFLALNSLLVLPTRAAQRAAVRTLATHLAPGGVAVVDIWLPDAEDLARYDGRVILEWPRLDPETGAIVTKSGSAQHDASSATVTVTTIFEEGGQGEPTRRWVRRDRLRLVSADDLREFAEEAGLTVELVAGDYDLGLPGPGSERAILIAVR